MSDSKTRYSDTKLKDFGKMIQKKINNTERALEIAKDYQEQLSQKMIDPPVTSDIATSLLQQKKINKKMIDRFEKRLWDLDRTLQKIEDKCFGVCEKSGELISEERLIAIPFAKQKIQWVRKTEVTTM